MNKVILIGNIANDVELKQTQNGKYTAHIRIACRRSQNDTDFINCIAFDKTAENISKFFRKGSRICIEGSIKTGSFDGKDGKKVFTTDVWISAFDFCENAQNGGSGQNAPYQAPAPAQARDDSGRIPPPQNYQQDYDYPVYPYF